jgi:hypothetical protein
MHISANLLQRGKHAGLELGGALLLWVMQWVRHLVRERARDAVHFLRDQHKRASRGGTLYTALRGARRGWRGERRPESSQHSEERCLTVAVRSSNQQTLHRNTGNKKEYHIQTKSKVPNKKRKNRNN